MGGDTPAVGALVLDAGIESQLIFCGGGKAAAVCFAHLGHRGHLVGAGTQLGGQGDLIAQLQRVDGPEVAVSPPVVTGDTYISVPDAGVLKMPRTLFQRLTAGALVNLDIEVQAGDLQLGQIAPGVVQVLRYFSEAVGGGVVTVTVDEPGTYNEPFPTGLLTAPPLISGGWTLVELPLSTAPAVG